MTTLNATASLASVGQTVIHETPAGTINTISSVVKVSIGFFHGVERVEGTDTTFTTSGPWQMVFATSSLGSVLANDRVYVLDDLGQLFFGDITMVSGQTITVSAWYQNEQTPMVSSLAPSDGSRAIINRDPTQLSYTVGVDVHAPPGVWRYAPGDSITFNAHTTFSYPHYAAHFRWDLGDGTILTGRSVTHTYTSPSPYRRVIVSILDDEGREHVSAQQVYVLA